MTDALLLLARDTAHARTVTETHARRLRDRGVADRVRVACYEHDPARDLADLTVGAETAYAVPMVAAHTHATTTDLPAALAGLDAEVTVCEPVGHSPAITDALADRADETSPPADASLILAGLGGGGPDHGRAAVEYHARRLRERYPEVTTAYLLRNPAVECARYNVSGAAVAVPVFVADTPASAERIPEELELDRGGLAYANPLGTHPAVTDAVHAEVERARVIDDGSAEAPGPVSPSAATPVAADGGSGSDASGTSSNLRFDGGEASGASRSSSEQRSDGRE